MHPSTSAIWLEGEKKKPLFWKSNSLFLLKARCIRCIGCLCTSNDDVVQKKGVSYTGVPYLSCCTVWRRYNADFYVMWTMQLLCSKQVTLNARAYRYSETGQAKWREENLWTTTLNASLSPLSCIVHSVFLTCKLRVLFESRSNVKDFFPIGVNSLLVLK